MSSFEKRAWRITAAIIVVYGGLVATHQGEFFPFSIYPMFSQAGRQWTKVVVRDISDADVASGQRYTLADLPGRAVPLRRFGISQDDVSNYVEKTPEWSDAHLAALSGILAPATEGRSLLVLRVQGQRVEGHPSVEARPFAIVRSEGARLVAEDESGQKTQPESRGRTE